VLNLQMGPWRFSPGFWPTLAMLVLLALTLALGNWQRERAQSKRALQALYDSAISARPIHVDGALPDRESVLYRRLVLEGRFDEHHTILLDNRVRNGIAGYHVLTPLRLAGSPRAVLVNRGWLAAGRTRDQVVIPPAPAGEVRLAGIAVDPHTRYLELGPADPAGKVWQNLDFARYARASGLDLQPVLLMQTSESADGLKRDWPRPDSGVATHVGYALQWFGLAATLVGLWLVLNVRRVQIGAVHGGEGAQR
jgi:surfeit locus 1 family protein